MPRATAARSNERGGDLARAERFVPPGHAVSAAAVVKYAQPERGREVAAVDLGFWRPPPRTPVQEASVNFGVRPTSRFSRSNLNLSTGRGDE